MAKRLFRTISRDGAPLWTAETLAEAHLDPVFQYLFRRLCNRAEAEDLAAQTFQAAFRGLGRLRAGSDPLPWLLGIARRELINRARRRKCRPVTIGDSAAVEAAWASEPTPERAALIAERRTELWKLLDSLAPDQREALLLQHLEGLSVAQIATVMKKSPSAIDSLLQRARKTAQTRGEAYFLGTQESTP